MKKEYYVPYLTINIIEKVDVITYSAGTLFENEYENEEQWWAN